MLNLITRCLKLAHELLEISRIFVAFVIEIDSNCLKLCKFTASGLSIPTRIRCRYRISQWLLLKFAWFEFRGNSKKILFVAHFVLRAKIFDSLLNKLCRFIILILFCFVIIKRKNNDKLQFCML